LDVIRVKAIEIIEMELAWRNGCRVLATVLVTLGYISRSLVMIIVL